MSSTLYQLSYSLFGGEIIEFALPDAPHNRDDKADPHNSKKCEMSLKVPWELSPCRLGGIRTRDPSIERAVSYHLTTNPGKKGFLA